MAAVPLTNLGLTDTAFRPPPPQCVAHSARLKARDWGAIGELSWHRAKAPHAFPGPPPSTREAPEVMPPSPQDIGDLPGMLLSSHLHWPSCSRMRRINLGLPYLVNGSPLAPTRLSLYYQLSSGSLGFFLPWAMVHVSPHHRHHLPLSLLLPSCSLLVHALGADPEPPSDLWLGCEKRKESLPSEAGACTQCDCQTSDLWVLSNGKPY